MVPAAGINLVGDLHSEGPGGQLARQFLLALDEARIPVHAEYESPGGPFAVDLVCDPASQPALDGHERWMAEEFPLPVSLPSTGVWADRDRFALPDGPLFLVLGADAEAHVVDETGQRVGSALDGLTEWEQLQLIMSMNGVVVHGNGHASELSLGCAMLLEVPAIHAGEPTGSLVAADRAWVVGEASAVARAMREVLGGGQDVERRVASAHEHVMRHHAPRVVGDAVRRRLALADVGGVVAPADLARAESAAIERRLSRRLEELSRRLEDVSLARDALEHRVRHVFEDQSRPPRHVVTHAVAFAELPGRHPPEGAPWTHAYNTGHRALTSEAIAAPDLEVVLGPAGTLPVGYGRGYDERIIELPWVLAQGLRGRTLDAGSALNHPHILAPVLREVTTLDVVTLAPEEWSYPELGISYVYADLRALPYRDGHFDTVVCLSTLDHVGMNNAVYGVEAPRADDPAAEIDLAMGELLRVLAPGGRLLITVPYGAAEDHGWLRQFDRAAIDRILHAARPLVGTVDVFGYDERGWRRSTLEEQATAHYRDHRTATVPVTDDAVAARAVACLCLNRA